jgi:hypothetical protein
MAGLDPAIHLAKVMDARVKPAHDERGETLGCQFALMFAALATLPHLSISLRI